MATTAISGAYYHLSPEGPDGKRAFAMQLQFANYNDPNPTVLWSQTNELATMKQIHIRTFQIMNTGNSTSVFGVMYSGLAGGVIYFGPIGTITGSYSASVVEEAQGAILSPRTGAETFILFEIAGYAATDDFNILITGECW